MKYLLTIIILTSLLFSCTDNQSIEIPVSFYHWKKECLINTQNKDLLDTLKTEQIYLRYFDIVYDEQFDNSKPTYLLDTIGEFAKLYNITPVVFIENQVMKKEKDIKVLADRIHSLVNEISEYHTGETIERLQIDCDWTVSTKFNYFELLNHLSKWYEVEATIRLHQVKYYEKTGIPPIKRGVLMLYNIGDLKNMNQNSILKESITKQYINEDTAYPLPLGLGLPWFSQTIIKNHENQVKIIAKDKQSTLDSLNVYLKKVTDKKYIVIQDTILESFNLNEGYEIKVETSEIKEVVNSKKICLNSNLEIDEIIIYHLHENINYEQIKSILN